MSRPRDATSVATRIGTRPSLKSFSARTRCPWLLLPWIAVATGAVAFFELLDEAVRAVLRAREDERLLDSPASDQVAEELALALPIDRDDDLANQLDHGVAARDLDLGMVVQQPGRETANLVRERGAEQQVLPLGREQVDDLADIADEAHVEHAIGFVQDQDLDVAEVDRALPDVVEQPSRGRHDDLGTRSERAYLRIEADAAVDRRRADRVAGAVGPDALLDLERELTGRREDKAADRQARGAARSAVAERQLARLRARRVEDLAEVGGEHGRLAGAGLGAGEDVAAGQHERNRLGLDGCWFRVALIGDGAEELGRQAGDPKDMRGEAPDDGPPASLSAAGPGQGDEMVRVRAVPGLVADARRPPG